MHHHVQFPVIVQCCSLAHRCAAVRLQRSRWACDSQVSFRPFPLRHTLHFIDVVRGAAGGVNGCHPVPANVHGFSLELARHGTVLRDSLRNLQRCLPTKAESWRRTAAAPHQSRSGACATSVMVSLLAGLCGQRQSAEAGPLLDATTPCLYCCHSCWCRKRCSSTVSSRGHCIAFALSASLLSRLK